ncbi:hypothetical protein U0070_021910 [Myodes glareolus]|uniref:Uncharacterized protein n=1 Tax=Myodes glareolus TaxID=447135 RepID=A0AAW0IEY0_MYOGA
MPAVPSKSEYQDLLLPSCCQSNVIKIQGARSERSLAITGHLCFTAELNHSWILATPLQYPDCRSTACCMIYILSFLFEWIMRKSTTVITVAEKKLILYFFFLPFPIHFRFWI